jgi:hypothetical protein
MREAVERLKEYRTALVSAAVTGKIKTEGSRQKRKREGFGREDPGVCGEGGSALFRPP